MSGDSALLIMRTQLFNDCISQFRCTTPRIDTSHKEKAPARFEFDPHAAYPERARFDNVVPPGNVVPLDIRAPATQPSNLEPKRTDDQTRWYIHQERH